MAKCSKCGAELIDLFTSKNVCPNGCDHSTEICGCGAIFIDGVHCFRDEIGAVLSNKRNEDIHIETEDIGDLVNVIKSMMNPSSKHSHTTAYSIGKPQPITFEYFKEGNSLRISNGKATAIIRSVFHVFFGDDILKFISFL